MTPKGATYQQLQRILAEETGCPVCWVGLKDAGSYLDILLWESVNDPARRNVLDQTLGLCGRHSREMLDYPGQRLGVAILEQAVLKEARRRLLGQSVARNDGPGLGKRLRQRVGRRINRGRRLTLDAAAADAGLCPACGQQQAGEARALAALLAHLPGDLDGPLAEAGGLCWPHLQMALALPPEPASRQVLLDIQESVWSQRIAELDEFIRKNDHRFRHEPISPAERAAVDRAIAILTGEYPLR